MHPMIISRSSRPRSHCGGRHLILPDSKANAGHHLDLLGYISQMSDVVPTYPQAILGYRIWRVVDGNLYPLHMQGGLVSPWTAGVNHAQCLYHKHEPPEGDCKCGFNAYHDITDAISEALVWIHYYRRKDPYCRLVIGAVAGCGMVRIHHLGFRCRQAQVLGLAPLNLRTLRLHRRLRVSRHQLADLCAHYQVAYCEGVSELQDLASGLKERHLLTAVPVAEVPDAPDRSKSIAALVTISAMFLQMLLILMAVLSNGMMSRLAWAAVLTLLLVEAAAPRIYHRKF